MNKQLKTIDNANKGNIEKSIVKNDLPVDMDYEAIQMLRTMNPHK